jgi:hypothetical protein
MSKKSRWFIHTPPFTVLNPAVMRGQYIVQNPWVLLLRTLPISSGAQKSKKNKKYKKIKRYL